MSKFFKALETAEKERAAEAAAAPAPPSTDGATPVSATTTVAPPERPQAPDRAVVAATPRPVPAAAPVAPVTPVVPVMPVAAAAPVDAATTVDGAVAAERVPFAERLLPAYGAPISEAAPGAGHSRAFTGLADPVAAEPGQVDDHLVSLLEPTSLAAEQYRTIRLQVENLRRERNVRVVAVSSPGRAEGKTVTAINLAGALAQSPDARVVLVETDLRHPSVSGALGLPAGRGLSTYLLDTALPVEWVVERPDGLGFAVVRAGAASTMPYELLKSPRLAALLRSLRERFDFVVLDTPPVLPFPDAGILRDLVDGFVVVVRANRTPRELLRDSLHALGAPRVIGVVLNDHQRPGSGPVTEAETGWRGRLTRPLGAARAA